MSGGLTLSARAQKASTASTKTCTKSRPLGAGQTEGEGHRVVEGAVVEDLELEDLELEEEVLEGLESQECNGLNILI